MATQQTLLTRVWYWIRVAICIVSFGMIFPNVLIEGMDDEIKDAPNKPASR